VTRRQQLTEAQIAALPAELHAIEETRWQEIVAWFKAHL